MEAAVPHGRINHGGKPPAAMAALPAGAIGISEEYDLQLLTRRLHEWRLADGSEGYWEDLLGLLDWPRRT